MSIKVSVFIATTLDGFISRINGDLDWLDEANKKVPSDEDCGYKAFMDTVDALVMGRYTYEKVLSFSSWPYGTKRVIVLSTQAVEIPVELQELVSCYSLEPEQLLELLSSQGVRHIYIDGGITIQKFLNAGLVNELTITTIPLLIGAGRRLFGEIHRDTHLVHISTKSFSFGCVQSKYQVEK
jgi:dihydrofolate reductase